MKKRLFILLLAATVVCLLPAVTASAEGETGGTCGEGLSWTLDEAGTLTISGNGTMADYTQGKSPFWEHRANIKAVRLEDGVASIGKNAFYSCTQLTSVEMADSVASIGDSAFASCSKLPEITIGDSVNMDAADSARLFWLGSGYEPLSEPAELTLITCWEKAK